MDTAVYDRMDKIEAVHWWFSSRRTILADTIRGLADPRGTTRLLEAGCGSGGNLQMLRGFGSVDAFEFDETARLRAERKSGLAVLFGALPEQVPFEGRNYDVICLFDVLEHIGPDHEALAALAERLAPGGRILVTVPAFQRLWSRHDERHHHFRRYTKKTLARAAMGAGLRVEHSFYFNCLLFPLAVVSRALKALLGSDTPDDCLPSPAVNAMLRRIFASERYFVGRIPMPFGLSLCAVLQRPG